MADTVAKENRSETEDKFIPLGIGFRRPGPKPTAPAHLLGAYSGEMINCSRCKSEQHKTVENFGVRTTKRNGNVWQSISGVCRKCDVKSQQGKEVRRKERTPHYHREKNLKKHYGLTIGDYASMLSAQDGKCAICRQESRVIRNGRLRPLFVDHNHETGKIRGLLCMSCNTAIAHACDDPAVLRAAADYLEKCDG